METAKKSLRIIVITGLSGAGKSQALQCLEDYGYFCVDNLPPAFIVKFAELCAQSQGRVAKAAIVCDSRGGEFFSSLKEALSNLEAEGFQYEMLFLESSDETLVKRYKESRRRHPLSTQGGILEGIQMENTQLEEIRGQAHQIIDTSNLTAQQLRHKIAELYGEEVGRGRLAVSVVSFGFKYGIPLDADLLIDVRFLPNPFYVEDLRPLTGEHTRVQEYVFNSPAATEFLEKYLGLLDFTLPFYVREGKRHLIIAVGCTGGQHRSVAIAERVAKHLQANHYTVCVSHRDAERNRKGDKAK